VSFYCGDGATELLQSRAVANDRAMLGGNFAGAIIGDMLNESDSKNNAWNSDSSQAVEPGEKEILSGNFS
jgi:hypothetical protein